MPRDFYDRLQVIKSQDVRYLVNQSDLHLDRIEIADILTEYYRGIGYVHETPVYEIEDIPPHSCVALPDRRKSHYRQTWRIDIAEWGNGEVEKDAAYHAAHLEVEEADSDAMPEETVVERDLHHLRTESSHQKRKDPGKEHAKRIFLYRDGRDLYLVNSADVGAERLQFKRKHSLPKLPARDQGEPKPLAIFEIRDLPAHSYVHLVSDFDPNVERYVVSLLEVDWTDGEMYRDSRWLGTTNAFRSKPLKDFDVTSVERTPTLIEEVEEAD